ncbi:Metallo-dependent hydrolase [Laetiporus sulphureus 93-53]|uniref:Probable guanine deaminase n=1 Tax=Laetiporus sulphureus 93-53 TaxID=1314785 RepID=A0A165FZW9_9APHY|nr:Metallo-dependent hydrolase [Laetiporus sulphureus 93-53]KZT09640.1 Metallo-dependent hydrolase [Laetiporus sulphureus 93-53]
MSTIFYGALISSSSLTTYNAFPHALLAVSDRNGEIEWLEQDVPASTLQDVLAEHGHIDTVNLIELRMGEFLMPGFVDTHTHAPQVPNTGSGQQHELLDWLSEVTFPMESRFADISFAKRSYPTVVRRTIDCGTTTCCYYGTLHLEATKLLVDIVHASGQRAFVGKCNMDRNCPDYYVEPSADASMSATRDLIAYIRALSPSTPEHSHGILFHQLVQPILTPRFAVSCTPELLTELGELAQSDPALPIQTHLAENEAEIAFTRSLFPAHTLPCSPVPPPKGWQGHGTYTGVYDAFGLLRENTILAHCVHLEPEEVEIIKARGAGVSHCPTSNFNLRSGCARIGMLLDHGIKVGLGTDVSGGFSPSILRTIQDASICSKVVAMQPHFSKPAAPHEHFANRQLSVATLLYLATLGGAQVCGLGHRIAVLEPGRAFDALVVSVRTGAGNPAVWGADMDEELGVRGSGGEQGDEGGRGKTEKEELEGILERFLFCGDDRNIRKVFVQGRLIGGKDFRG